MPKIDKLLKDIAKFKQLSADYKKEFLADGKISDKEQAALDKLNAKIAKVEQKLIQLRGKQGDKLLDLYDLYKTNYEDFLKQVEKDGKPVALDEKAKKACEKSVKKLDKILHKFLAKYADTDTVGQQSIFAEKGNLDQWNQKVLTFKENNFEPVKDLSKQKPNPKVTRDSKKQITSYTDLSTRAVDAITQLFATGKPGDIDSLTDIHHNDVEQGYLGDCYFLAALAAVAKANPNAIRNLITPKGDGTYDVRLYVKKKKLLDWRGLNPVIVNITAELPTHKEGGRDVPIYAAEGDKELWVPLVEKAYAELNGKKYKSKYKRIEGGYGTQGIEAITGQEADKFNPKKKSRDELIAIIQNALVEDRAITAGTRVKIKQPNKRWVLSNGAEIFALHEYYIININATEITLRNPHGSTHYYGGDEFKIPLDDFVEYYNAISVQL